MTNEQAQGFALMLLAVIVILAGMSSGVGGAVPGIASGLGLLLGLIGFARAT